MFTEEFNKEAGAKEQVVQKAKAAKEAIKNIPYAFKKKVKEDQGFARKMFGPGAGAAHNKKVESGRRAATGLAATGLGLAGGVAAKKEYDRQKK